MGRLRVLLFETPYDPYCNIAFEEAMARARGCNIIPDTIRFFRNSNAVIIGYFQKAEEEVNMDYLNKIGSSLVRRATGGGAVYHDMGNLNYSIALSLERAASMNPIDYIFKVLINGAVDALKALGLPARLENINDIVIGDRKVSGTAASTLWGSIFFHGAMLLNTDISRLSSVLKVSKKKLMDKGISSVKYRVTNLFDIKKGLTLRDVVKSLVDSYSTLLGASAVSFELPSKEELEIAYLLYKEKYKKEEWNMERLSHSSFSGVEKEISAICRR